MSAVQNGSGDGIGEKAVRHVTGNKPISIAIIGLGPTMLDWNRANFTYERQHGKPDEVWTLNKGLRTIRADVGFVMDDMVGEARISASYAQDLADVSIPIITSTLDRDVRDLFPNLNLHAYPLAEVQWAVGRRVLEGVRAEVTAEEMYRVGRDVGSYLHNSIPYMLAYAFYIGVKQVALFGCDYTFKGQEAREDDRANTEYWIGMLRGFGMGIQAPHTTTLLNICQRRSLYGYGARAPVIGIPTPEQFAEIMGNGNHG